MRTDGRGVRIAPMPHRHVKIRGARALVAARNAALLVLADRGLSSAEIAAIPGIALDERSIRMAITSARRLRNDWQCSLSPDNSEPSVTPIFGCQPWEPDKEELPGIGADCPHCGRRIAPASMLYCPKCASTGFDLRFAHELGEAVRHTPIPIPPAKGKLLGRAPSSPSPPPTLTPAHRAELARTPQGYLWLKSIGQLPAEASRSQKDVRRERARA